MRTKKVRLNPEELINFFKLKLTFDKSETDASLKYCWPSTKKGLYNISDIIKYFASKGIDRDAIDDMIYDHFQYQDLGSTRPLEKGKTHFLYTVSVFNHNPEYKQSFNYYCYDLTREEAYALKKEYEAESLELAKSLKFRKFENKKQNTVEVKETSNEPKKRGRPKKSPVTL